MNNWALFLVTRFKTGFYSDSLKNITCILIIKLLILK